MNIVITGASRGIGYQLCKQFVADGNHKVLALARSGKLLENLSNECRKMPGSEHLYCLEFDLSSANYTTHLIPFVKEKMLNVDVLINNAGLLINKTFSNFEDSDFDKIFDVNVKSIFKMVRDLLPFFNPAAHIVNMSSMGGVQGSAKFPGLSLYSASKGAVGILTECLAEELKEEGVSVNALAIGAVQTEMLSQAFPDYKAPLSADEMAGFIKYFALQGKNFFNGKVLPVSLSTP